MVDLSLFVRENNHPECIPSHRYLAPHPLRPFKDENTASIGEKQGG